MQWIEQRIQCPSYIFEVLDPEILRSLKNQNVRRFLIHFHYFTD